MKQQQSFNQEFHNADRTTNIKFNVFISGQNDVFILHMIK